uniref:DUF1566 domain-containing protein n=1 Tax=Rhizophagus irregularis (strain DAOM 181602 / DAOM 197198 / MUCL 43194) TaxID=747089 RepID=U9T0K2_RHIID
MKSSFSFTIIVAIIFIQVLTPFTEVYADHTVWIHNKVTAGTWTNAATVLENKKGNFDWHVPDNVQSYWLAFRVGASTEEDKWRGPFNNDGINVGTFMTSVQMESALTHKRKADEIDNG